MTCWKLTKKDPEARCFISWNPDNKSFEIKRPKNLQPILSKYFRSDKYKSLVRQLNIHGFKKKWACEKIIFSHIMFKRGFIEDLKYIKREPVKNKGGKPKIDEQSLDYETLNRHRDSLLMLVRDKEQKIKQVKLRKIEKILKQRTKTEDKEKDILQMVHLLFRSKGLFEKEKLIGEKTNNPDLGLVLDCVGNNGGIGDLSNVLNSVKDFSEFAKDFYKLLKRATIFDSGYATPYKMQEEDGIQMMVPVFKISPMKETKKETTIQENTQKKDLLGNSNFRTYIRESEKNLGRELMSQTSEFLF